MPSGSMPSKLGRILIWVFVGLLVIGGLLQVIASYTGGGIITLAGSDRALREISDNPPPAVYAEAERLAVAYYSEEGEAAASLRDELLALYQAAEGKDVVLLFNPGGWGTKSLSDSPGWQSIADGIAGKLNEMGYDLLTLDYHRTEASVMGYLNEVSEITEKYQSKAGFQAVKLAFLTGQRPDLDVFVSAESNGVMISDQVIIKLEDNPHVYGICTGPPFWYDCRSGERMLLLSDNGIEPDAFSRGDVMTILSANIGNLLGLYEPQTGGGDVLNIFLAPGHYYDWQYPVVSGEITRFVESRVD